MAKTALRDLKCTEAVVVSCMDFRLHQEVLTVLNRQFGIVQPDLLTHAGGAKSFSSPENMSRKFNLQHDIQLAIKAHSVQRILLLTHECCGKYAEEGRHFKCPNEERDFHFAELRKAGDYAQSFFREQTIIMGYVRFKDNSVYIEQVTF